MRALFCSGDQDVPAQQSWEPDQPACALQVVTNFLGMAVSVAAVLFTGIYQVAARFRSCCTSYPAHELCCFDARDATSLVVLRARKLPYLLLFAVSMCRCWRETKQTELGADSVQSLALYLCNDWLLMAKAQANGTTHGGQQAEGARRGSHADHPCTSDAS